MGNRVFAYGIQDLYKTTGAGRLKFESIILAAADLSVEKFLDSVDYMLGIVSDGKLIILCSPDDKALQVSSSAQKQRIGLCTTISNGRKTMIFPSVTYDGVNVFIYQKIDFGGSAMALFHGYFFELPEIIDHIRVITGIQPSVIPTKFKLINKTYAICIPKK